MKKRNFRIMSILVIMGMLVAMTLVTAFSASAFEPLDGEESAGSKATIGPLDSREEGVSQTISYPDDYFSAVTYAPLDGEESEDEQSEVPTDPSSSEPTPSATETASEPIQTEPVSSATEPGGEPTIPTIPTIPTMPTNPTMPSQSGTSNTDPSASVKTPLYGDANDDGAVNMKDVLLMRKYMAEMPVTISFENSDVDVSGTVNMKDVLAVRKFLAEIIDTLGPVA